MRHLAKFVLAAEARQHDVEIAFGELAHRRTQTDGGLRDAAPDHGREYDAENDRAERQPQHRTLGIGDQGGRRFLDAGLILRGAVFDRGGGGHHFGAELGQILDERFDFCGILDDGRECRIVFLQ